MGISDIWWLDMWVAMASFTTILGLIFLTLGLILAALEENKDDAREHAMMGLTIFAVFAGGGILFPFLPLALVVFMGMGIRKAFF